MGARCDHAFIGNIADRRGRHRRIAIELAFLSMLCMSAQLVGSGFVWVFAFTLLASVSYAPVIPLVDGIAIRSIQETTPARGRRRPDYAAMRIWGSAAFLAVALLAGIFLEGRDREWILYLILVAHLCAALTSLGLPKRHATATKRAASGTFWKLLARRELILLFVAVALIQGSHGCYYAFGSIWWERVGHSRDFIGVLWAEGVLAEIVFFLIAARFVTIRPKTLLYLGAIAAVVRWLVIATRHDAFALLAVQWLHAFSFGATHLAAMRWMQAQVAPERIATAQTLLATVGAGLGPGLAIALSGPLFKRYEATAFFAMVGFAVVGAAVAFFPAAGTRKDPLIRADRPRVAVLGLPHAVANTTTRSPAPQ